VVDRVVAKRISVAVEDGHLELGADSGVLRPDHGERQGFIDAEAVVAAGRNGTATGCL
jgi:hypothetical protein